MKKILGFILLIITSMGFAQQDPLFTHYMFNKLALNPAYAGSRGVLSMDMIDRYQWVGIDGAPQTFSFGIHAPLRNEHIGIGLYAYRDALGPTVDQGVLAAYAYRIIFPTGSLAFGLQFGINYKDIDWSKLNPSDNNDLLLNSQVRNKIVPDADFGIYYYSDVFYLGVSSKHLLENEMVVATSSVTGTSNFTKLLRHFYGTIGGVVFLSDQVAFKPSCLIKYVSNAPVQADFNASFLINNTLWLGASYRTEKAVGLMLDVNLSQNLHIGYSYDIWFNELLNQNKGSHEFRIGYDFDLHNKSRMITPRYF